MLAWKALRSLSIVVALLAALFPAAALRAQELVPPGDESATRMVIEEQIAAFKAGDHARAYSHAAPNIQQVFPTVERFISMVQGGYMALYDPESYTFGRNALISGQVHQEVIVTDEAGKQWQAVYTLIRQPDGSWKISGVKLNPYKGLSA